MSKIETVVAICPGHAKAGQAVRKLQQSGFDIHKLSVVANGAQAGADETIKAKEIFDPLQVIDLAVHHA